MFSFHPKTNPAVSVHSVENKLDHQNCVSVLKVYFTFHLITTIDCENNDSELTQWVECLKVISSNRILKVILNISKFFAQWFLTLFEIPVTFVPYIIIRENFNWFEQFSEELSPKKTKKNNDFQTSMNENGKDRFLNVD